LESIKQYPEDIQRMIGYSVSAPFCGWVNLDDPLVLVVGEDLKRADLY